MKQTISRTITTTTVNYVLIEVVDGKPEMSNAYEMQLLGKYDSEKAEKELDKELGKKYAIVSMSEDTATYEMDLQDFIQNATVINKEEK